MSGSLNLIRTLHEWPSNISFLWWTQNVGSNSHLSQDENSYTLHHKSTLKSLRLWAFGNFKKIRINEPQVPRFFQNPQRTFFHFFLIFNFVFQRTDRELAVIEAITWFFPIFWESWLHTSENWYFDILRTVIKNSKYRLDNHWGSVPVYDIYPTM